MYSQLQMQRRLRATEKTKPNQLKVLSQLDREFTSRRRQNKLLVL